MTIQKGVEWGRSSHVSSLVTVVADTELAEAIALARVSSKNLQVQGGDTWTSLGRPVALRPPAKAWQLPCDAVEVVGDLGEYVAYSSVVLRRPWWRGGVFFGDVWCVSLTGIFRGRNVAPRAHANDGFIDVVHVGAQMGVRQRLQAWSRARRGDHLPHVDIDVVRTSEIRISTLRRSILFIDGRRQALLREIRVSVLPDEWIVSIPWTSSERDDFETQQA